MCRKEVNICLFLIGAELLGTVVFLSGFFPSSVSSGRTATRGDLPRKLESSAFDVDNLYRPRVRKIVLMVVDALRYDFVGNAETMPFTVAQISDKTACLLEARAHPPTVTLPRIKALVTGTLPNYADVVMNFGSDEIGQDNLIDQALANGLRVVFYGDDTWLKLFPKKFTRSEGTSSFFVSDYTEVDANVTRNLDLELERDDWDIMVLHYLGLDHIGHLEGPKSTLVPAKLLEMDSVISRIQRRLDKMESVVIVCGDHGMKDSGGHGGTSLPELSVPVIIFNHLSNCDVAMPVINQIDLVPFVSFLMGLPIPGDSIAKLDHRLVDRLDSHSVLYGVHYSARQMAQVFVRQYGERGTQSEGYGYYLNAANLFDKWTQSRFLNQYNVSALWHYSRCQQQMSDSLIRDRASFDMYAMIIAVLLLFQVFLVNATKNLKPFKNFILSLGITLVLICINYFNCIAHSCKSVLCNYSVFSFLFVLSTASVISVCFILVLSSSFSLKLPKNPYLAAGTIMQIASLGSSSFIEEEHQVWYFLFVSVCLLWVPRHFGSLVPVLLAHRFLRSLNQTGDQWAALPDLGDWLNLPANKHVLTAAYLIGQTGTVFFCVLSQKSKQKSIKILTSLLIVGIVSCAVCYRLAIGTVSLPFLDYSRSKGLLEAQAFWYLISLFFGIQASSILYNGSSVETVFQLLSVCLCLVCSLLFRPHNVLLLPALFFCASKMNKVLKKDTEPATIVYYWLGKVFYFFQGNSNSLASIDVAAGYVGLSDYHPLITGSLVIVDTFAAHLLAYLLLVRHLSSVQVFPKERVKVYRTYLFLVSLELLVYSVLVIIQRHHLFVWSVFSPKLLYMSAHVGLYGTLLCFTEIIVRTNQKSF